MSRKGTGKFLLGATIGAGLALLFAPDKGENTRKKLKLKLDDLMQKAKNIDADDIRNEIVRRVNDLKIELADLDKEKVAAIAKNQAVKIQKKAEELYKYAVEKGTPILENITKEVRDKALQVAKDVVIKLENNDSSLKTQEKKVVKKRNIKRSK